MSASIHPLRGASGGPDSKTTRREDRQQSICRAEFTPYPRVSSEARSRVGFTLNESASGLCIGAATPEAIGTLLCVRVVTIDGRAKLETLARVVWCQETDEAGHYRIGLSVVAEARRKMLLVRPGQRRGRKLAESA